jgi:hypothetical protein
LAEPDTQARPGRSAARRDRGDLDPQVDLREPLVLARLPLTALASAHLPPPYDGRDGRRRVRVTVSAVDLLQPVATRKQADLVIWATSQLTHQFNRNGNPLASLHTTAGQVLAFLGRAGGGAQRNWLHDALRACVNTQVMIETFDAPQRVARFRLIERFGLGTGGALTIDVGDWLVQEVHDSRILRIPPAALALGPIERRIYSLARSQVGEREGNARVIPFWEVYDRSGSVDAPRKFRQALLAAATRNALPGFAVRTRRTGPSLTVVVEPRHLAPETSREMSQPVRLEPVPDARALLEVEAVGLDLLDADEPEAGPAEIWLEGL